MLSPHGAGAPSATYCRVGASERLDRSQRPQQSGEKSAQRESRALRRCRLGPAGPAGPQGPAGPASLSTTIRSQNFISGGGGSANGEVRCPDGMVATGGGVSPGALFTVTDEPSSDGRGWVGAADGPPGAGMRVVVICTPGSATVS